MGRAKKPRNGHGSFPEPQRKAATLAALDATNPKDLALLAGLARRPDWEILPADCSEILDIVLGASRSGRDSKDFELALKAAQTYLNIYKTAQAERHHQELIKTANPDAAPRVVVEFVNQIREVETEGNDDESNSGS